MTETDNKEAAIIKEARRRYKPLKDENTSLLRTISILRQKLERAEKQIKELEDGL